MKKLLHLLAILVVLTSCQNTEGLFWLENHLTDPTTPIPAGTIEFSFYLQNMQGDPQYIIDAIENNDSLEIFSIFLDADTGPVSTVQIREYVSGSTERVIFDLVTNPAGSYTSSATIDPMDSVIHFTLSTASDTYQGRMKVTNVIRVNRTLYISSTIIPRPPLFYILDPNFRSFLQINHPEVMEGDSLIISAAPTIETLLMSRKNIADLTGIEFFTGLTFLDVSVNQLSGSVDLSNQVLLQTLRINNNRLSTIAGLGSMPDLLYFQASFNDLTSIAGIENASKLIMFEAKGNDLASLPSIANYPDIQVYRSGNNPANVGQVDFTNNPSLRIYDMPLTGITGLSGYTSLTNLIFLDIMGNEVTSLNGLESATSLFTIDLENNQLNTLPDFTQFPVLEKLVLSDNPIQDTLLDLSNNPNLFELRASDLGLTQIDGLSNLPNLQSLYAERNSLKSVAGLENATKLEDLYMSNNQMQEIPSITNFPELENLGMSHLPLTWDAGPDLSNSPNIRYLSADYCNLRAIYSLPNATNLQYLSIEGNKAFELVKMTNISPGIQYVNIKNNWVFNFHTVIINQDVPNFLYTPQKKMGEVVTYDLEQGDSLRVGFSFAGEQGNVYQWFKEGLPLTGANEEFLSFDSLTVADGGVYTFNATNPLVPDLILESEPITLIVTGIEDDVDPVLSGVPVDITVECDAIPRAATVTADDDVDGTVTVSFSETRVDGACADNYTLTRTWEASDQAVNTATGIQFVTVEDTTAPSLQGVPSDTLILTNEPGLCGASLDLSFITASDNCTALPSLNFSVASGTVLPIGDTQIGVAAEDACGNVTSAMFIVTVNDVEAPTLTPPASVTVSTDAGSCEATNVALGSATSADNCSGEVVTNDTPASFPIGTTVVNWMATDAAGNIATATQNVTVEDTEAPTITPPADITVSTDAGSCEASNVTLGSATSADNCTGEVVTNDAPASFPIGATGVTWTATDATGNIATATQSITVEDTEPPMAVCQDISVTLDAAGFASITAADINLGSSDNCGIASLVIDRTDFTCADIGAQTVQLTVVDDSGNARSCNTVVTVVGSDTDGDAICDNLDNCPATFNPDQLDADGDGFGEVCDADDTNPFINPNNAAPIANAGPDANAVEGDVVVLDGTGSSDPDGDPLTYNWQIVSAPAGSTTTLSSTTAATPSLTPDVAGTYTIQLIVNDGLVESAPDQLTLTVDPGTTTFAAMGSQINDLVASGSLNAFQGRLFNRLLNRAENFSNQGRDNLAIINLRVFRFFVTFFKRRGALSPQEANPLIQGATELIDGIRGGTSSAREATSAFENEVASLDKVPMSPITVYPNPFDEFFEVEYFSLDEGHIAIQVFDLSGNEVLPRTTMVVEPFMFHRWKMNLGEEHKVGIYLMVINDGLEDKVYRLLKR